MVRNQTKWSSSSLSGTFLRGDCGGYRRMGVAALGVLLIVVGAVLKYAITATVPGVNLQALGGILLVAGVIVLVLGLLYMLFSLFRRRRRV
jgi:hypothetical protein